MQNQAIEDVVEVIARRLDRGLSLEDPDGVLLAYSSHQTTADRVRVNFLLSKRVPADVSEWQLRHGTARAVRPVVVPANQDLGMLGRVCVPLLVRGFRVGYLWVQQQPEEDPADGILAALPGVRAEIDRLAALLLETNSASSEHRARRESTFFAACAGIAAAAEELRGWRELGGSGPWCVVVVRELAEPAPPHSGDAADTGEDPHQAVLLQRTLALQATVGVAPVLFSAGTADSSVLLCSPDVSRTVLQQVRQRYLAEVAKRAGRPAARLVVGVSGTVEDLRRVDKALQEAQYAVQAAAVDPALGNIARHADIGVYQFLGALGWNTPVQASVHFAELVEADHVDELLPVLELLYDKNGSVQDVAGHLHLHRSSVYNRLARIRSVIGADPLAGTVRLELHLALKARRWRSRPRFEQA